MNDNNQVSKSNTKLFKIICVALPSTIIVLGTIWVKCAFNSETASNTTTQGSSSPVSSVTGNRNTVFQNFQGNLTITTNELNDLNTAAHALTKDAPEGKTYTAQEVMDEIKKARQQREQKTTEQEAENQADEFLTTLTFQLAKVAEQKKKYENRLEALPGACKLIFNDFIVNYIDSYISNIENNAIGMAREYGLDKLKIKPVSDIKDYFSETGGGDTLRIITFPNSNCIEIDFQKGIIVEKKLTSYPAMSLSAFDGNHKKIASIRIHNMMGGGFGSGMSFPTPNDNGELDDSFYDALKNFKKQFKQNFNNMIVKAISHDG